MKFEDNKEFSSNPTAKCCAIKGYQCNRGDGDFCYCKLDCSAKLRLSDGEQIDKDFIMEVINRSK